MVRADTVTPRLVEWLWPGWLPFGKLVDIVGPPGVGKSTAVLDLIARATRGVGMPFAGEVHEPVTVMIAGVEDGWADTIRPRLDAAGADLTRVHFVMTSGSIQFTIPRDVPELVAHAARLGARWLHIDAIFAALSEQTNAYSDHQVRRALARLRDAAEKAGLLVTSIRHPRKSGGNAINAGGGSVAFGALARMGLFVGFDPSQSPSVGSDRRRILAVGKSNLGVQPASLVFTLAATDGSDAARVDWLGASDTSAEDLAAPTVGEHGGIVKSRRATRTTEAEWLKALLVPGAPVERELLQANAARDGLKWDRVKRAARDLRVMARRTESFPSKGVWIFPDMQSEQSAQTEQAFDGSPTSPASAEFESG